MHNHMTNDVSWRKIEHGQHCWPSLSVGHVLASVSFGPAIYFPRATAHYILEPQRFQMISDSFRVCLGSPDYTTSFGWFRQGRTSSPINQKRYLRHHSLTKGYLGAWNMSLFPDPRAHLQYIAAIIFAPTCVFMISAIVSPCILPAD